MQLMLPVRKIQFSAFLFLTIWTLTCARRRKFSGSARLKMHRHYSRLDWTRSHKDWYRKAQERRQANSPGIRDVAAAPSLTSAGLHQRQPWPPPVRPVPTVARTDWASFSSLGRVSEASGNLEALGNFEAAIAARSCENEIIFFIAEQNFFNMALNYVLNLRSVGYAHWMLLAPSAEACSLFNTALGAVLPGEPSGCVWSKLHASHPGWAHHSLQNSAYKKLQVLKMHYPAMLLAAGLNVLLTDVDVAFPRNFYPDVKSSPLAGSQVICQRDMQGCNLGIVYCQNASRDGPAQWLFAETTARILRGLDPSTRAVSRAGAEVPPGPSSLLIWDQVIFNDVILGAMTGSSEPLVQINSKPQANEKEVYAMKTLSQKRKLIAISIPDETGRHPEHLTVVDGSTGPFANFGEYVLQSAELLHMAKPHVLHCVHAPRGASKKFCLSAWGFWNSSVDFTGVFKQSQLGIPYPALRSLPVLRLSPESVPADKAAWLGAVHVLFRAAAVLNLLPLVPDIPCNSTGWHGKETITTMGSKAPRCLLNHIEFQNHWAGCGEHAIGTAVQLFRWEQITSTSEVVSRSARSTCDSTLSIQDVGLGHSLERFRQPHSVACLDTSGLLGQSQVSITGDDVEKRYRMLMSKCPLPSPVLGMPPHVGNRIN
uniref:Uncharacterized protein n=1 Tax=Tetraselmis sp. GSL018 TaxID=582737 RepID=A0A061S5G9_9CHLO